MAISLTQRNWTLFLSNFKAPKALVLLGCFAFLSVVFTANPFDIVPDTWLRKSIGAQAVGRIDPLSEALVFGRMIKSRSESGVAAFEGLGLYNRQGIPWSERVELNETMLRNEETPAKTDAWLPYQSEFGLQGIVFTSLYQISPFGPSLTLDLIRMLCAVALALSLTHILSWVIQQADVYVAVMVAAFLGFSPWLVAFADSPYWVIVLAFLPINVILCFLSKESDGSAFGMRLVFFSLAAVFLAKALSGYIYFSAVVAAAAIPLAYYWLTGMISPIQVIARTALVAAAGVAGFLISFLFLSLRKAGDLGLSFAESLFSNIQMAMRRTLASDSQSSELGANFLIEPIERTRNSLDAPIFEVVQIYLTQDIFLGVPFFVLAGSAIAMGVAVLFSSEYFPHIALQRRKLFAFYFTFVLSLCAPLSWYSLGKAHAYIHTFWSSVVWYVPALLFAALFVAYLFRLLLLDLLFHLRRVLQVPFLQHQNVFFGLAIVSLLFAIGWAVFSTSQTRLDDRAGVVLREGQRYALTKGWDAALHGDWIYLIAKRCSAVNLKSRIRLNIVIAPNVKTEAQDVVSQKLDFRWKNNQIALPMFGRFHNTCMARKLLPEGTIKKVSISEESPIYDVLWQAEFEPNYRAPGQM